MMISAFNVDQLRGVLADFYRITGIRLTVFDEQLREILSYPAEAPAFCSLIRSAEAGTRACACSDREGCRRAQQLGQVWIYRCHAGLTEAAVPLYVSSTLVGFLLFGHLLPYPSFEEGWPLIEQRCGAYGLDRRALKEACRENPIRSEDYIRSAARILQATASYLILQRIATVREDTDAARLDAYLSRHFTEALSSQSICKALGIGRSKLYQLSDQLYGCGISQRIRRLRMELAARLLLEQPKLSIAQVAERCGYADYNYFISSFSSAMGTSPNRYRKEKK